MGFRLAVWNCNMRLHDKLPGLAFLRPDVVVVPECACPEVLFRRVPDLAVSDMAWVGRHASKGLGVFAFGPWRLALDRAHDPRGGTSIPLHVSGPEALRLLAVWAIPPRALPPEGRPPEPLARALARCAAFLNGRPAVVAGDFNDALAGAAPLARSLQAAGFVCAAEAGGAMQAPTFYRHRSWCEPKPRPSDRIFVDAGTAERVATARIGRAPAWTGASDHVPVVVEIRPP